MVMYRIREVVTVVLTVLLVCGGLTGCACCRPRPKPFPETVMVAGHSAAQTDPDSRPGSRG